MAWAERLFGDLEFDKHLRQYKLYTSHTADIVDLENIVMADKRVLFAMNQNHGTCNATILTIT